MTARLTFCVACEALNATCRRCRDCTTTPPHPAYWLGLYHAGDSVPAVWHRLSPTCSEVLKEHLPLDDGPSVYEFAPLHVRFVVSRRSSRPVELVELATTPHTGV